MIAVRVPGTTANLGPGFDCLGMALSVYGKFYFEERPFGLKFENVEPAFCNGENLAVQAYFRALERMGLPRRGLYVKIESDVPISSGLGSSASLLVAGAVAASAAHGRQLSRKALLELVTEMEGHPDNVAPALLGGLTASITNGDSVVSMVCPVSDKLHFCALIPDFSLSTKEARAALPLKIPLQDAVFNIARVSVLLRALERGDVQALALAMEDRLHQPYRAKLIDEYADVRAMALRNGAVGLCISGAGPTLLTVYQEAMFPERMMRDVKQLRNRWRVLPLEVDTRGATVIWEEGQ